MILSLVKRAHVNIPIPLPTTKVSWFFVFGQSIKCQCLHSVQQWQMVVSWGVHSPAINLHFQIQASFPGLSYWRSPGWWCWWWWWWHRFCPIFPSSYMIVVPSLITVISQIPSAFCLSFPSQDGALRSLEGCTPTVSFGTTTQNPIISWRNQIFITA